MTETSSLEAAARRYFENTANAGHYERDEGFMQDYARHAAEVTALRCAEVARWSTDWGWRLGSEPRRILDAGCGPGFVTSALARHYPHAEVVGIDLEDEAIELARATTTGDQRVSFVQGELESLPSCLGSFDLIVCRTTLEHVRDPRQALARMTDALQTDGSLYLETPNYLFPYEPHVRLWMLPKSPKALLKAECRLFGRDPAFVDHLQFSCDTLTLKRWARAHGGVRVADLMQDKVAAVIEGRATAAVASRGRIIAAVARRPRLRRALVRVAPRLPLWPSAQLLVTRV